ncbi:hypothetical protein HYPSUDRAFT_35364 [Hypholoma sublateritium FD-334 SS-4]|uniref:Snf7-domain-containing protein n=1 Tax=Hypholoma sublateritium (strain FD-334 SS-4) TaxID=945553 RepID=A0A0D2Q6T7_HYPSF|nr:hypothetical protein HYPSUDRAFT_35364 [Hypholoma sublateritium FD-334 SS-4]
MTAEFSPSSHAPPSIASLPPFSTTSIPRLQALYSDFSRQKLSNPASYSANVEWWRKALEVLVGSGIQHSVHTNAPTATPQRRQRNSKAEDAYPAGEREPLRNDRLVLHGGRELLDCVKIPKVGKPLSLGAVLSELRTIRAAIPLSEFLSAKASIYDSGWLPVRIASYVVGKPLWWALEQVGIVGEEGLLGQRSRGQHHKDTGWWGAYVMVHLVEAAADAVLEIQEEIQVTAGDALYTMDTFRTTFGGVNANGAAEPLRETDAQVLIKYLERDRGLIAVDKEIIKFIDKQAPVEERAVTAVDRGILELKSAIRNLTIQVDSLHSKIDDCTAKATAALHQKRKPAALSYLRSRKQFEDLLNKRLGSLSTLESTFMAVEAAAGDIGILKSYETSVVTLRAILAHPSLERSSIDKTMEALADANADAKEIDNAVRFGGDIAVGVNENIDDEEVEAQWKAMVKELEATEKSKESTDVTEKKLNGIGKSPDGSPLISVPQRIPALS